ncbi:MAG: acetoacetate decarboxylase family protein [Chloroflexi bacterium]|nr:acetoacetate decarboxylase family protein [Chloroflexota bacterium]
MDLPDVESVFETPFDNPLVPRLPIQYRNCEILTAFYRTNAEAARRLVPEPLELTGEVVIVHLYHANDTDWFGHYDESAVQIPVRLPGTDIAGVYSPYLFLSNDGAVAAGREIYGQPKKGGQPRLEAREDLFVGTVTRNGIDVITVTLPYKQQRAPADALNRYGDFRTNINLKVVPNADGSTAIRQLTARTLSDVQVRECWSGGATIELRANAQAPVYRLPVIEMLEGFYWRVDFVLPFGRVIHDYLRKG